MLIGIDGNEANVLKRVGISEYAFELLHQFKMHSVSSIEYQVYLKENPVNDLPKTSEEWKYRIVGPKKLWTQIGLPFELFFQKPRPDVFFTPTHYAPRFSPIPTVVSVMDLAFVHYPELFKTSDLYQLNNWTKYSVRQAQRVLTISKATKNDIISVYKVPEERVVVTYPGIKTVSSVKYSVSSMDKVREKFDIKGEYILFVGTLQPRKNIERLVEAFAKVIGDKKHADLELLIVGKKGWLYEDILNAPKKYNIDEKVKFLEFVTDGELEVLYKNAECFVLPSLYEGFGLPVLEAMKHGCPVITSNVSSLPEAGGDAAEYIEPENVDDIASKMKKVLEDINLRKSMIQKGYAQVKNFSWEKTAKETLTILEEVAKQ